MQATSVELFQKIESEPLDIIIDCRKASSALSPSTIASTIGAIIWAPVLLLIGYYAGEFLEQVPWLMPAVIVVMIVCLVIGTILGLRHYRQEMAKPAEDFDVERAPSVAADAER